jgi:hypothetical protein
MRPGMVAGDARSWAAALRILDGGRRRVPLPQQNSLLDALTLAIDAEAEAAAAVRERLPRRKLPRLTR